MIGTPSACGEPRRIRSCFHNVAVKPDEIIGEPGSILGKDMSMWSLGYTAVYIGIAEAAYQFTVDYVKKTKSGLGVPLGELDRTQRQIGEMAMLLENARRAAEKLGELRGNLGKMELTFILNPGEIPCYRSRQGARRAGNSPVRRTRAPPLLAARASLERRGGRHRHAARQRPLPRNHRADRPGQRSEDARFSIANRLTHPHSGGRETDEGFAGGGPTAEGITSPVILPSKRFSSLPPLEGVDSRL